MTHLQLPTWNTELPHAERIDQIYNQLEEWIRSDTLQELSHEWGGAPPHEESTEALFDWFDEFSESHWDFRKGRERNLATAPVLSDAQAAAAVTAADSIGLSDSRGPSRAQYDYALILGGLVRACMTRPAYAAEVLGSGATLSSVVALGGFRALSKDEVELGESLGANAENEFGAMIAGLQRSFAELSTPLVDRSSEQSGNAGWAVATFEERPIQVIAAPSREPDVRRANTADTFAWWAKRQGSDIHHANILLITNPIYVPYQGAAAIENLAIPFDVNVETVGISSAASDLGTHTQVFGPPNFLQETRSAIRGYRSLLKAVKRIAG